MDPNVAAAVERYQLREFVTRYVNIDLHVAEAVLPTPAIFAPDVPPPGFELKLISFWQSRAVITPRLQLVHTNAAPDEGDVDSAYRWANQQGSDHTIPHFQIDRDGRSAMLLPLNRKGIANYKVSDWSIAIETADTGTNADPSISQFTDVQAEKVAQALAYSAIVCDIPLEYPTAWDGAGTACHTEPFGYPYWTNANGKTCPGPKKKDWVRRYIIPRAVELVAEWTAPPPPVPTPPAAGTITVQAGEGWYGVARRAGVPMNDLILANPMPLHPGMVLKVPT